jgi:uncharacterized membrane protein YoaK (UPF0700 family)
VVTTHLVNKVLHHDGGFSVVAAVAEVLLVVGFVFDAAEVAHAVDRAIVVVPVVIEMVVVELTRRRRGGRGLGRRAACTGVLDRGV